MGHRALVVYDIAGHYIIAHSHWGSQNLRLEDRITADSLRSGSYPEQGLLNSIAEAMRDDSDESMDADIHIGGNTGDKDVDEPMDIMSKPCSIGDVLAQHGSIMYEAVYIVDVTLGKYKGISQIRSLNDIEDMVVDVDVTGYYTLPVNFFNLDDAKSPDTEPALAPPLMLYRGSREAGNEASQDIFALEEAAKNGVFDLDEVANIAVEQAVRTIHQHGGYIPTFSPVGSDIEQESINNKVRTAIRRHRNSESQHSPSNVSMKEKIRSVLLTAFPL